MSRLSALLVVMLACAACGRTAKPRANVDPGAGGTGGSGGTAGSPSTDPPTACTATVAPGPAPLTRLSARELERSLEDSLGGVELELVGTDGRDFSNDLQEAPNVLWLQRLHGSVHDAALRFSQDTAAVAAFSGCAAPALGTAECRAQFLVGFLRRAFRRPATDEDLADMNAVFDEGERLGGDAESGARAVVEVALQSPEMLYLYSLGEPSQGPGLVALTSHELSARLSFFLTGAPPDAELRRASDAGKLDAAAAREQARRLLGTPLNREQVRYFYEQRYGLSANGVDRDDSELTNVLLPLANAETARFIDHVTFEGAGTFRAMLLDTSSWVSGPLAQLYGVSGVTSAEPTPIQLDASRRAGLFTRALFLANTSHGRYTNPAVRGLRVLSELLCQPVAPPPPDVAILDPGQIPASPSTTRQRLTAATAAAACQDCHRDMNPLGFAFEHYDPQGRWRDTEEGLPIDSSGELYETDAQGTFQDALDLMKLVADSEDAHACFVDQWARLAYRRELEPADDCARERLSAMFAESDGKIVDLLVELATSDNFRYRAKSELAP